MPANSPCPAQRGTKKGKTGGLRRPGPDGKAPVSAALSAGDFQCGFPVRNLRSRGHASGYPTSGRLFPDRNLPFKGHSFAFSAPLSRYAAFPSGMLTACVRYAFPGLCHLHSRHSPRSFAAFPEGALGGFPVDRSLQTGHSAGPRLPLSGFDCRGFPWGFPGRLFPGASLAQPFPARGLLQKTRGL